MLRILLARLSQGHRTSTFPAEPPLLPERFRGHPLVDAARCPDGCAGCVEACPTGAIASDGGGLRLDLGRCLFCNDCVQACPEGAISHSREFRLSAVRREDLVTSGGFVERKRALEEKMVRLFRRSLKLRVVSAGGCNGCEADVNVLGTVVFDLGRFGIQYVASPRHADGLLITGPVTENMRLALKKTYDAVPPPKIVIATGACAISGGPYIGHEEVAGGASALVPVDVYIPGCPPHPFTILDGLLAALDRLGPSRRRGAHTGERAPLDEAEAAAFLRQRARDAVTHLGADLGKGGGKPNGHND